MVPSVVGAVVVVPFPFTDLSDAKRRPAIVLADAGRGDWILCQMTSKAYADPNAIFIADTDFVIGSLRSSGFARPSKLFTASSNLILSEAGVLDPETFRRIREAVISLFQA
ncbi:hypothetical protein CCAX7_13290 [Capsulimonas corticalis]|uniref:Uncharacterized protein n=1 Tax=Capsulimonas corticalis TaxID=2219043 RepID=A0A402D4I5_9BACT|nr:type II toxin-antitoxin system PemK/MazF family toxin [Capsulimonas corticalis]BDI29278.1 hypothetical protein CCAX7_13290 [Capsulimonas corticalis]